MTESRDQLLPLGLVPLKFRHAEIGAVAAAALVMTIVCDEWIAGLAVASWWLGWKLLRSRAGTSERPIRIRAETTGGAEVAGRHGFAVKSPAAFVEIDGFRFTHAAGQTAVEAGATHVRFTRNVFACAGSLDLSWNPLATLKAHVRIFRKFAAPQRCNVVTI